VADETTNSTMSGAGARDVKAGADQVLIRPPIEVVVDADSLEIINSNAAAQRHMGFGDYGIAGPTMGNLTPVFSKERAGVVLRRLRDGLLDELVVETHMRAVDGSRYPVEAHITCVADPTPRYVAMMLDISARKAADERTERLERLRDALAELLRAMIASTACSMVASAGDKLTGRRHLPCTIGSNMPVEHRQSS
jgi:PAS domain S-box-containing protein